MRVGRRTMAVMIAATVGTAESVEYGCFFDYHERVQEARVLVVSVPRLAAGEPSLPRAFHGRPSPKDRPRKDAWIGMDLVSPKSIAIQTFLTCRLNI
jgi:hypothetical protein